MKELELSSMLVQLRKELQIAQEEAANADMTFKLEDVEVEVNFTVSDKASTGGGFKFYVSAEVGEEKAAQTVHRIKLKMTPETTDGGDVKVSSGKTTKPK